MSRSEYRRLPAPAAHAAPSAPPANPAATAVAAATTVRPHDDDLRFLGKMTTSQRVGLVDCQRYGLRDFGHDGKADRRNAGGQNESTRQDIPEQSAAINCSHLFAPWFKFDRSAGKAENNLISLPGLGRDALATLIAFCKRTGYGAAKT